MQPAEYCLFWVQSMCMPRSDWASWVQAFGSIAAIVGSVWITRWQFARAAAEQEAQRAQQNKDWTDHTQYALGIAVSNVQTAAIGFELEWVRHGYFNNPDLVLSELNNANDAMNGVNLMGVVDSETRKQVFAAKHHFRKYYAQFRWVATSGERPDAVQLQQCAELALACDEALNVALKGFRDRTRKRAKF